MKKENYITKEELEKIGFKERINLKDEMNFRHKRMVKGSIFVDTIYYDFLEKELNPHHGNIKSQLIKIMHPPSEGLNFLELMILDNVLNKKENLLK
jgi:hypothetical protein